MGLLHDASCCRLTLLLDPRCFGKNLSHGTIYEAKWKSSLPLHPRGLHSLHEIKAPPGGFGRNGLQTDMEERSGPELERMKPGLLFVQLQLNLL